MRKLHYLLLFFAVLIIESCVVDRPCKNAGDFCPDSYESLFRITGKLDGKDLLYGPDKVYDKSAIRIFSVRGADTAFANYQPYRLMKDGYDSVLYFKLASRVDTLFVRLNAVDVDTITLSYGMSEGRCCSFHAIRAMSYNHAAALPNDGTVAFKK
jgi:hypothetical protein